MSPERQTPVPIEEEMRKSYLDYAMSVIVGRALPDVRDGLKPVHRRVLFAMHELGSQLEPRLQEVGADRRRGARQVPSARRRAGLRGARPHGAGVLAALPAGRRAGQLRLHRRRPARGDALHRGAPGQDRPRDAGRHRQGHGRLRRRTSTRRSRSRSSCPPGPEPARQRLLRHRGRHGDEHPAPQPERGGGRARRGDRQPRGHHRRADEGDPGPGLPDPRLHLRPRRASARPTRPGAASSRCGPRPTSRRCGAAARRSSSPSCRTR